MVKVKNENQEFEELEGELKPIFVQFKGEEKVYEFKHAFICGQLEDNDEEISTIISGFDDIQDFVTNYNNMLLQAFEFLYNNGENAKENVVNALKESANKLFDGILNGELDGYFEQVTYYENEKEEE